MAGFKIQIFSGLSKKISPRLLAEDIAQNAQNVFLDSGRIEGIKTDTCLLYTSPSPRDATLSRMPSSA